MSTKTSPIRFLGKCSFNSSSGFSTVRDNKSGSMSCGGLNMVKNTEQAKLTSTDFFVFPLSFLSRYAVYS